MNERLDIRKIKAQNTVSATREQKPAPASSPIWELLNRDIRWGFKGLADRVKENFYQELYTLLGAGVDIRTALELVRNEQKKKKVAAVFDNVLNQVVSGTTLSGALKKNGQFSSYEYFSVQIGEETGKLNQVLNELSGFFQKKIRQRRQVMGAITYPAVVLTVAFAAISFMITYVVPMFSDIFSRFGSDLPAVTKMVIGVSVAVKKYAGVFLLLLAGLIAFIIWQRKKEWFRKFSSALLLKLPVTGAILQKIYLSRFANTMSLLAGARIPLVQAIRLTRQMITFYPIEQSLTEIEEKIIAGVPLHKGMSDYSIYPPKMVSMVKVGEEVNQMELFFTRIAEQYAAEVEYQASLLNKLLEPLIIVILGLVVGIVLIAMYLPLFRLGQAF